MSEYNYFCALEGPHSAGSPVRKAYKNMKSARMWEKYDKTWERKKVFGSEEEESDSISDSEEDDFALSKIPLKKTKSDLYSSKVISVLHQLQVGKKKRQKKDIRQQVKEIRGRVSRVDIFFKIKFQNFPNFFF